MESSVKQKTLIGILITWWMAYCLHKRMFTVGVIIPFAVIMTVIMLASTFAHKEPRQYASRGQLSDWCLMARQDLQEGKNVKEMIRFVEECQ